MLAGLHGVRRRHLGLAFQFGLIELEGVCELQMDLIKDMYGPAFNYLGQAAVILAAHGAFTTYVSNLGLQVLTGGDLEFQAFNVAPSYIEADITNAIAAQNDAYLIGPDQVSAVQGLFSGWKVPKNLNDVFDDFQNLVDVLQAAGKSYNAAHQLPDSTGNDCLIFDNSPPCIQAIYSNGFSTVYTPNGFAIPAPVLVVLKNKTTGEWASGLFNFVPSN